MVVRYWYRLSCTCISIALTMAHQHSARTHPHIHAYTHVHNPECLREHGYTPKEFYQQCREAEKGTSEQRFLVDLILGITNFDAFKDLMLQQKELLRAEEEREM